MLASICSLYDCIQDSKTTQEELIESFNKREYNKVMDTLNAHLKLLLDLKESNSDMDFEKIQSDMMILNNKKQEYMSRMIDTDNRTNWSSIKSECESITELIQELKESQELLDSFKCLPPDLNLARMELQRKRMEGRV